MEKAVPEVYERVFSRNLALLVLHLQGSFTGSFKVFFNGFL